MWICGQQHQPTLTCPRRMLLTVAPCAASVLLTVVSSANASLPCSGLSPCPARSSVATIVWPPAAAGAGAGANTGCIACGNASKPQCEHDGSCMQRCQRMRGSTTEANANDEPQTAPGRGPARRSAARGLAQGLCGQELPLALAPPGRGAGAGVNKTGAREGAAKIGAGAGARTGAGAGASMAGSGAGAGICSAMAGAGAGAATTGAGAGACSAARAKLGAGAGVTRTGSAERSGDGAGATPPAHHFAPSQPPFPALPQQCRLP